MCSSLWICFNFPSPTPACLSLCRPARLRSSPARLLAFSRFASLRCSDALTLVPPLLRVPAIGTVPLPLQPSNFKALILISLIVLRPRACARLLRFFVATGLERWAELFKIQILYEVAFKKQVASGC